VQHGSRLSRLRARLREEQVDALVISLIPNVRYLTDFTGSHGIAVVTASGAWFLTDSRYRVQCVQEVRGFKRIISSRDLFETIVSDKLLAGCRRVAFESESVTYAQYVRFRGLLRRAILVPSRNIVESLTIAKEPCELEAIRRAVAISDRVFADLLGLVKPGVTERELSAEISYRHRRHGAEGDAFEPIVASGVRGALPHARASAKRIRTGEFVTLDFGCTVQGYCSDLTRTVALGRIAAEQRRVYATVLAAQREALDAARSGMKARDLDAIARARIAAAGFGKYFTHSLGHGLGLRIHERPRISSLSSEQLQVGSVVTIEPGIYIPGHCGVRIEDDIVLTSSGCTVLTGAPKELLTL
jgi:Xaa-Pro aminopeptidase